MVLGANLRICRSTHSSLPLYSRQSTLFRTECRQIPAGRVPGGPKIPVGTTLPISLEHVLSSKDLVKGEVLEARLMQDVPLAAGGKIPAGSKILGSVVGASYIENGPSSITFRFTSLEAKHASPVPIVVALRAMATFDGCPPLFLA